MEAEIPQLSREGIEDLCRRVPFVIDSELPDACSSNRRKKARTILDRPHNCFVLHGDCGAHQIHRCVEHKERRVVGDVYAIAVTLSNLHFANRMQQGLMLVLRDVVVIRGHHESWGTGAMGKRSPARLQAWISGRCVPGARWPRHVGPCPTAGPSSSFETLGVVEEGAPGVTSTAAWRRGEWGYDGAGWLESKWRARGRARRLGWRWGP